MRPRRTSIVAASAIAVLVAGCGGGDDSTESTPTTTATTTALTKAELIEQGDAICAEVNAAVGTVSSSSTETSAPAAQAAGLYSGMVASLKNLGTPQEAVGYPEFIAAADSLATVEGEVKLAAERGDSTALVSAESSASTALSSFQTAAAEYGFEECSEGPKPPSGGVAPESVEAGGAEAPGAESESAEVAPEAAPEEAPEIAPETGGAGGGTAEGGGTGGGSESGGGDSGGIGPG